MFTLIKFTFINNFNNFKMGIIWFDVTIKFVIICRGNAKHFLYMLRPTLTNFLCLPHITTFPIFIFCSNTINATQIVAWLNIIRHCLKLGLPNACSLNCGKSISEIGILHFKCFERIG